MPHNERGQRVNKNEKTQDKRKKPIKKKKSTRKPQKNKGM